MQEMNVKLSNAPPTTVRAPWTKEIRSPFKKISKGDCEAVGFLGKVWIVTMDEMVITCVKRASRVEEGLITLTAVQDSEVRRMTTSAYYKFFGRR